ncbi:MAG: endopeptidase La [Chlorobia bacterium]|nr:endopeptidase La [Fimbriimonadaceae bacterium]
MAKAAVVEKVLVPVLAARDAVHFPSLINTLNVVREPSVRAIRKSMEADRRVLVLSQRDMGQEDPRVEDLYKTGTLSEALQALPMPDTSLRVVLKGLKRARATRLISKTGTFWAEIEEIEETESDDLNVEAVMRACVDSFGRVVGLNKQIPPEAMASVVHVESAGRLADAIAHHLPLRPSEKQALLEQVHSKVRLERVFELLKREEQILDLDVDIRKRVERELGDGQREFYLREQLKIIQTELQHREQRLGETDEYREKIDACAMPEAAHDRAIAELRRLDRTPASSPEGMVLRNYLDCMVELPWNSVTEDQLDVASAKQLLDDQHFGLDKVKTRILDYLAVRQLKGSMRGPILCFVGPPGVGKTSIANSIAEAMGRKFVKLALGGVRDEAEIRGHRRTYVGSMPGRIVQGLRQCGSRNPVIVLDEIDKLGADYQGDPTSALLEALDPQQNDRFSDHYIEAPFDLSEVMFVATANLLENIPAALRDRMEVIHFPSYTDEERLQIAKAFLVPRTIEDHGLQGSQLEFPEKALKEIIRDYTREAGVRDLGRAIAAVSRKAARLVAEGSKKKLVIDEIRLAEFLGQPRYRRQSRHDEDSVGAATGLVVSEYGGDVISIEVSLMEPHGPKPELSLTGNLGDVMKESAMAAVTFVRANSEALNIGRTFKFDVHVHVPQGSIPKDGPSAGVTIGVALASAASGRAVRRDVAMTGEVTLRGKVLPVGGIRDKVLAAHRAGMKLVIIPAENATELEDVPASVLAELEVHLVADLFKAIEISLLGDGRSKQVAYGHDPYKS